MVLLAAAALALALANSPAGPLVAAFWQGELGNSWRVAGVQVGPGWLVADLLMPIFFFSVGLELRGELGHGVLSEWRRAALPLAATLGGMLVPALTYLAVARAPELRVGWGVPTATDIAFALGVLALLGRRVPQALRALLLALAVLDDLGAIVVIALFYSKSVQVEWLGLACLGVAYVHGLERLRVRGWFWRAPGVLLGWWGCYASGVHPTIVGVALGLALRDTQEEEGQTRTQRLGARLKPWVELGIMPIFALANAGVVLRALPLSGETGLVALAVGLGLLLGKPLGVVSFSWLALRLGLARLPPGLGARGLLVLGSVAGVGFTMALFVAQLAFTRAELLSSAKLGIVSASVVAAIAAFVLGLLLLRRSRAD